MTDHTEGRMHRCALAMRKAFFAEFGDIETMDAGEIGECSNTIEEQVRMCGNSVPPPMSMVLSAANLNIPPAMPFGKMQEAA